MNPPISVRPLTALACKPLEVARRASTAVRLRRAPMVLASAPGSSANPIAQLVGGAVQTARHVMRTVNAEGLACLAQPSNRPKGVQPTLDAARCEQWRPRLHQSPRTFGQPTGVWTLALAAQVCHEQGLTERLMSDETMRRALKRLGAHGQRATHGITSPDPPYARKNRGAIG